MKVGTFRMDADLIRRDFPTALRVMAGLVVVRAEHLWHAEQIEYTAVGQPFEDVETGCATPAYEPQFEWQDSPDYTLVGGVDVREQRRVFTGWRRL